MHLRLVSAWVVAVAAIAITAAVAAHLTPTHANNLNRAVAPFFLLSIAAPAVVGVAIATRQPRNVVAWILLLGALSLSPFAYLVPSRGWALQISRATWPLIFGWPIAVAYVFPNGRFLSTRWRRIGTAAAVCFGTFMTLAMLDHTRFDAPNRDVRNPLRHLIVPGWIAWVWVPLWFGILASLFVGAYAIRLRLRRATGVERLQTLWLAWSASLLPLGLVFAGVLWPVTWLLGSAWSNAGNWLMYAFVLLTQTAVALSIGVAVARYRLYAIERLVSRTLVYATVTVLLAEIGRAHV